MIPAMPQMITASSHGETPEIVRNLAASEAPRSALPKGVSTADANQVTRTIAVIRLDPTNAHFQLRAMTHKQENRPPPCEDRQVPRGKND